MSFRTGVSRICIVALIVLTIGLLAWAMFLDSMSIAHNTPMWRRLFLPRSVHLAGSELRVPLAYGIVPQERGFRVVYRFPPLTEAQVTFVMQMQRFKDSTANSRPGKTLRRCETLPSSCTTWFADPPSNRVACTEAHLGVTQKQDLGSFGFCYPRVGPVHGVYGCSGTMCATARDILIDYFRQSVGLTSRGAS